MKTRAQKRAYHAYSELSKKLEGNNNKDEIVTGAKKLPSMIQNCGLVETLAFYQKDALKPVRAVVEAWLKQPDCFQQIITNSEGHDIVQKVANLDLNDYRMVRTEAIEYATWLKRAAEAEGD